MNREMWEDFVIDVRERPLVVLDGFNKETTEEQQKTILWADSRIKELEEAVEWALAELAHIEVPWIREELRRRAKLD
jgi:hypothetical protein